MRRGHQHVLLDGQHRLTFISQLPEGAQITLNVSADVEESTFDAIDQGFRRTPSDVLGVSAGMATVGRLFAKIMMTTGTKNLSVQYVAPFVEWVAPEYEALISYCPGQTRIWSSAPMRAAAVYQMKRGLDADFIKLSYHSLVMADIEAMPHAARALTQQFMSGKIVSARTLDLFCRGVRAFDPKNSERSKNIVIRDQSTIVDEVRAYVISQMKKGPAKARPTVAKPVAYLKARA